MERPADFVENTRHVSVLFDACMEALLPAAGKVFFDGTLGGGGHTEGLLERGARVVGCDWDDAALLRAGAKVLRFGEAFVAVRGGFEEVGAILDAQGVAAVDGVLLDLGLSSDQLDDPARGLSYHADGPLDMRLRSDVTGTAADILNGWDEEDLADLFFTHGEEPRSRLLAREIVGRRKLVPWQTTGQLLGLIEELYPAKHQKRSHPAARIFQALRVGVNDEMGQLARALPAAAARLKVGGRLAVITFQPAEDRMVKRVYRELAEVPLDSVGRVAGEAAYKVWKKREPTVAEVEENPRARSAKLRVLERVGA